MEAATPLHRPQVRVQAGRLVVDALVVDDAGAVRLVEEREGAGEDPAVVVEQAIEIGARVLDREQAVVQTEYVRAEFERQAREVEVAFTDKARVVAEHFGSKVDEVFAEETGVLSKALLHHFDDGSNAAVQHRVRTLVDEVMRGAREDLLKTFSSADGSNPLADFKHAAVRSLRDASDVQERNLRALHGQMAELKAELQGLRDERKRLEEVAAEREKGTAKGRSFEEAVAQALDEIAQGQGDVCEAVGDVPGALGKKGDVVVDVEACAGPPRGRIVFEAKDKQLSRPKAMTELDEALASRSADFAVLVVPTEAEVPARLLELREYGGDKLVVVWDAEEATRLPLELAYKLARARILLARSSGDELDTEALRAEVARAVGAMDEVRRIKLALTGAAKQVRAADELVSALEARVRGHLGALDALLAGAAAPEQLF